MPAQLPIRRLLHLVLRLQQARGRAVPFEDLRRFMLTQTSVGDLNGGYERRTLQRDVQLLAETLGLEVKHRRGQGYCLNSHDPLPAGQQQLLEAVALQEFLALPAALAPFVQPEARRPLGLEHLRPLLRAAQARQVVEFEYLKHWEDAPETRTAGPLLLKEFRGQWYVLTVMARSGRLACYGLDRIQDLRPSTDTFQPPADFDAATYYADAFGITRPPDEEPHEVLLRFEPTQGCYALSYPLHASQRVLRRTDDALEVSLRVFLTHELYMELLSYGAAVEVLAPARLREWVHQGHAEAAN